MVADLTKKGVNKKTEKVEKLEVVVKALVQKLLSLENDLKDMKTNKKIDETTDISDKNCLIILVLLVLKTQ